MRRILSILFALFCITATAQSQDSSIQKRQDAVTSLLNRFPADRTEFTADQLVKPVRFEWADADRPGEKNLYTLVVYRIQPDRSLQELVKARPVFTTQVTGNSAEWQIPKEYLELKENSIFAWTVSTGGKLLSPTDLLNYSVFYIIGQAIPWPPCNRSWLCPAVTSYSLCSSPSQVYNIPAAVYSSTGFCPFASFPVYSIDGQPAVPYTGSNITVSLPPGQHTIVFSLFSFVYPVPTCTVQVNIFPRIAAMIDKQQICSGEDATVSIPPFAPGFQGYSATWLYNDNGGISLPAPGVAGSPAHTNAITPACTPAQNFVMRSYMPVITGTPSWPVSCIQSTSIKVWCPTQAGTISVSPTPNYCANSQTFTLTYSGGRGTITGWKQNNIALLPATTSNTVTLTRGPGTWTYTVTVKNGTCAEASVSTTVVIEAPLTATITGNTTEVCPNGSATLQLTSPAPAGTIINWYYQVNCTGTWMLSGVTGPVQNSNNIGSAGPYTPTPVTSLCWRAVVSSGTGICPPVTSNTWTINIIQPPCTPVITAGGTLPKCPGSAVTLSASTFCGTGPFTYRWYLDGIYVGAGPTWSVVDPGEYTVEVFNRNNCESRVSLPFTVKDCINIITITGPCNVPARTPIQLCAAVASDPNGAPCSSGLTYVWSSSAGPGATPNLPCNTWSPGPAATTTYNVVVRNAMGCKVAASWTVKVCQ